MKKVSRFSASLLLVFFLGFFFAGGRELFRPETLSRLAHWASEAVAPSTHGGGATPHAGSGADGATAAVRLKRLIYLRDAIEERKPKEHFVPVEELPDSLIKAIVAVEDNRFYSHPGFDIEGIFRAALVNLQSGEIEEGASTITQQLVKNLFLSQERSFARKAEELALAVDFEYCCSKDEILSLYLNTIYFGSGYYGIYTAAHGYFGKEPGELTLPEAAMLAGLPNAPSLYSPYENFLLAKKRQCIVLDAMVRTGVLDEHLAESAKIAPLYLAR